MAPLRVYYSVLGNTGIDFEKKKNKQTLYSTCYTLQLLQVSFQGFKITVKICCLTSEQLDTQRKASARQMKINKRLKLK